MRRPWYTYLLLFVGSLALLGAAFRPVVGVTSAPPGGWAGPRQAGHPQSGWSGWKVLSVRPGSPLARAGLQAGDVFIGSDAVEAPPAGGEIRWRDGIPRAGTLQLRRGGRTVNIEVEPEIHDSAWAEVVQLAWSVTRLLNVCLVALALALFWQRPRDGRAVLLGLVLLSAPVFALPGTPRLLALTLAAHFFAVFPSGWERHPRRRAVLLYLPFLLLGGLASAMWDGGQVRGASVLFHLLELGYAGYGLARTLARRRGAPEAERPVIRTLTVAAGAILAAVVIGQVQPLWIVSDQVIPANLLPSAIFAAATAHLLFRLRALELRVTARRTLQYLLARWTLGTLFLIPGFLLVWRFGQLSVTKESVRPGELLAYLLWMFIAALLLRRRTAVLRNLDRRFFRDHEAAREALIRVAQELGGQTAPDGVLRTLEQGVAGALRPASLRFALPDVPPDPDVALSIPVRRGKAVLGVLHVGPRETGEEYTAEERQLLEAACVQAAVALENSRLSAALLARQRAELSARTAGVLAGAEEERRRLAADLHDQVLPELRQIAGQVERLRGRANGLGPELDLLEREIRASMDSVRDVMEALRPSALDMLGLADALESYFRKSASRIEPPLVVTVRRQGEEPVLAPAQSLALFRIGQEAINNVVQHAAARRAGMELLSGPAELRLAVWDDGRGLDPDAGAGKGHGLANMRYRADLIGAAVSWSRPEAGGTRVEIVLPLGGAADETDR